MTTATKKMLEKRADATIAQFATNGGLLLPEQADRFIDMILDEPTVLKQARVVRMNSPTVKINRIGFASRILRAARQNGSAEDSGGNGRYVRAADRAAPTTSQIEITEREIIAEIRLPYELLEDNIEGQALEAHVMRLIAERAAIDLEEWALWADTSLAGTDDFLGLADGWLKRASAHVADNQNAGVSPDLFVNSLLALPQKYHRQLGQLRGFISPQNMIRYRQQVSQRQTGYGDSALVGDIPIYAQGLRLEGAPALSFDNIGNQGLMTFPKNLIFGIRRNITVETDKDIRSREIIIVLTLRAGLQIDDADAVVKLENI